MRLAIINEGQVYPVTEDFDQYDLDKPIARAQIIHDLRVTREQVGQKYEVKPNKALVEGGRYQIRYRNPMHRFDRLDVMDYLGDDYSLSRKGRYVLSARPIAGTQHMPMDWVISMKRVDKSTPIVLNRIVRP